MDLLQQLRNAAGRLVAQANPFDNGATWQNPSPTPRAPLPPQAAPPAPPRPLPNQFPNLNQNVQQQIMGSTRLNGQQKQALLQHLNTTAGPVQFNPLTAAAQSLGAGLKQTGQGLLNMTGIPSVIDAARLGTAALTHNQGAIDSATSRLANNLPQFLPVAFAEGIKPFAQDVATAATAPYADNEANQAQNYAQRVLNDKTNNPAWNSAVDSYAAGQRNSLLNSQLNTAGFDQSTPTGTLVRKVAGHAALAGGNVALSGSLPSAASQVIEQGVLRPALTYGALNAGMGLAGVASSDNPTLNDYAKAALSGFASGAALPLALHGADVAGRAAMTGGRYVADLGLSRPTPLSDAELQASQKVLNARQGLVSPMDLTSQDAHLFNNAQAKLGVQPGTVEGMGAVTDALNAHRAFDVALQQRQTALRDLQQRFNTYLQEHPPGLGTRAVDDEGNPVSAFQKKTPEQPAAPSTDTAASTTPQINRTLLTGRMLDVSNKELASAMTDEAFAKAFGVSHADARRMLAELRAQGQDKRPLPDLKQPRTAQENTDLNPLGNKIQQYRDVAPGDYRAARVNGQRAENGIINRAKQALLAIKRTGLGTSDFADLVEGTRSPATEAEREAVTRYQQLTNYIHATSQALGGNTNYLAQYFRHKWDLSDPAMAEKYAQLANERGAYSVDPYNFGGVDRQPRVFDTVQQGESAGFKLANPDASDEVLNYAKGAAFQLKQQALAKGILEADMNAEGPHNRTFDFGNGTKIEGLTPQAVKELRSYAPLNESSKPVQLYRKANRGLKQTLLSLSEFHPINIAVLKAGPSLLFTGHPDLAARGVFDTFRSQIGSAYSDRLMESAVHDELPILLPDGSKGTINTFDAANMLGTPIRAGSDFNTEGVQPLKPGLGERTIFDKAMPAMHVQMVRGLVADLSAKGIPLDSPEAREAGLAVNNVMGFVNKEVQNVSNLFSHVSSDALLANQFTRSKWATLYNAFTKGGQAGRYARGAVIGNVAAEFTLALAVGYLANQRSDDMKDLLLRTLTHPSIPTPWKDANGNTIELSLPQNYISEAMNLVATLQRGQNGRLGVNFNPQNFVQNAENYARNRLAVLPSAAEKLLTNTDFAGKPLYDPNASLPTKAAQAGTTLVNSMLPIGLQGVIATNPVKQLLPQDVQQVLNAQSAGRNPLLNSATSAFGFYPRTDTTVGHGQQTNQYFTALNTAKQGLNAQEQAALQLVTGSKKNPVTGQYDVVPQPDDSRAKAAALLQNSKVIDHLMTMNQNLSQEGQNVDPLWLQPRQNIISYYQYQSMPPGGSDRANWQAQNQSWYNPLSQARAQYFATLPPGDPNKPKSPIQYPTASATIQNLENQFFNATPQQQRQMIQDHPELLQQFQAQHDYTNQLRSAEGYAPLNGAPAPSPRVQGLLNQASATTNSVLRSNIYRDPEVSAYMQASSAYELAKNAALAQLQGNQLNQQALKAAYELGNYDMAKNPNGTYALSSPILLPTGGYMSSGMQPGAVLAGANSPNKSYQNGGIPGMKHRLLPYPKKTFSTGILTAKKGAKLVGSAGTERSAAVHSPGKTYGRGYAGQKRLPTHVSSGSSGLKLSKRKVKVA